MDHIEYSEKYFDDTFEYRHVVVPPEMARLIPRNRLLSENEWRAIGVQQSRGWIHYDIHRPEPHIMLFRRPLNYQQQQQQEEEEQQRQQQQQQDEEDHNRRKKRSRGEEQQQQDEEEEEEEEEQNHKRKRSRGEEQSASEGAEDQMPTK